MLEYVSPNDDKLFGNTDSETIQNAIFEAEKDGCRSILIPRFNKRRGKAEWRIPVSIKIPSNFTVILDNCYMVQETGVYDNMFTNTYSWDTEKRTKAEYEQENIAVIGKEPEIHEIILQDSKFNTPAPAVTLNASSDAKIYNMQFDHLVSKGVTLEIGKKGENLPEECYFNLTGEYFTSDAKESIIINNAVKHCYFPD